MEQGHFGGQSETGMSGKHCGIFGRPMSAPGHLQTCLAQDGRSAPLRTADIATMT
jgi:hypothetical protein